MATDTIPARSNGQTIDENWFNLLRTILGVDFVPRNASGVATAVAGSLGSSTYPWYKLFLGAAVSGLSIEESSGTIILKVGGVTKAVVSSSGLEGSYLKALSVATAAIADDAITTAKILNSNVTGAKIETNVNLAGLLPTSNSKRLVVCSANPSSYGMAVLRGGIDTAGNITVGEGFSVSVSGGGRIYTITYTLGFSDAPAVAAVAYNGAAVTAFVSAFSSSGCTIKTSAASDIQFVAIGQRGA